MVAGIRRWPGWLRVLVVFGVDAGFVAAVMVVWQASRYVTTPETAEIIAAILGSVNGTGAVSVWPSVIGQLPIVMVLQWWLLLAVLSPRPLRSPAWSVWLSAAVAGMLAGFAVHASVLLLVSVEALLGNERSAADHAIMAVLLAGAAWAAFAFVFARFMRARSAEKVLAGALPSLLLVVVVALAIALPLDWATRRHGLARTPPEFSSDAIRSCVLPGLVLVGPVMALPWLLRRRKRYFLWRCETCGYDMSGTMDAARCPECGAAWKGSLVDVGG